MGVTLSWALSKRIIGLLFFFTCLSSVVSAQPQIGFYGLGAFPQNIFNAHHYRRGFGGGVYVVSENLIPGSYRFPKLSIGLNADYEGFGNKKFKGLTLDTPQQGTATVYFSNNSLGFNTILRLSLADHGHISPYVDLTWGGRFFFTRETIQQDNPKLNPGYEESTSDDISRSTVMTLGIGGGLLYRLSDDIQLDVSVGYVHGGIGSYLALHQVARADNQFNYATYRSTTDLLLVRLGLLFRITSEAGESAPAYNTNTSIPAPQRGGKPNKLSTGKPGI